MGVDNSLRCARDLQPTRQLIQPDTVAPVVKKGNRHDG